MTAAAPGTVHIVGAGLAGLAAAVSLAGQSRHRLVLHEAATFAGGRCRSYHDRELGCRIDNGNHLLLSGNAAVARYLHAIGAEDGFTNPPEPLFPFADIRTGERWTLRPGNGRLPFWVLKAARRVPGSRPADYLTILRLALASTSATIADLLDTSHSLFRRLWGPIAVAALNTEPEAGSARAFWTVIAETFGKGGAACRPLIARAGLSESLVDPAMRHLEHRGCEIRLGHRLRRLELGHERVSRLEFSDGPLDLGPADGLVLAVPAPAATGLLPGLVAPEEFRAILNLHLRTPATLPAPGFLGLVGGLAEWVFARPETLSVTVSAADRHLEREPLDLAREIWRDLAGALDLVGTPLPPWRLIKERRATFAATPRQLTRRPPQRTRWRNLVLAGDWTDTGLPATIEGAVRSGEWAAGRLASATGMAAA